jgi:hypothetical protein
VGYGDVIPGNSAEKLLAMLGMVLGVTVFAYFMGAMGNMLDTLNASEAKVSERSWARGRLLAGKYCLQRILDAVLLLVSSHVSALAAL